MSGAGAEQGSGRPPTAAAEGPDVDLQVDEGLLIVASALRLAMKNRIIVRALRDGGEYDEEALVAALQAEIADLVAEKEQEAARLEKSLHRARRRKGWATWHDDYRQQDVPVLQRRAEINRRLLGRLRFLSTDPAFLAAEIAGARDSALDEIVSARLAPTTSAAMDPDYPAQREHRLRLLRGDLDRLRASRG